MTRTMNNQSVIQMVIYKMDNFLLFRSWIWLRTTNGHLVAMIFTLCLKLRRVVLISLESRHHWPLWQTPRHFDWSLTKKIRNHIFIFQLLPLIRQCLNIQLNLLGRGYILTCVKLFNLMFIVVCVCFFFT